MEMKVNLNKRTILDFPTTTKRLVDGPINLPSEALAIFPAFSTSKYHLKQADGRSTPVFGGLLRFFRPIPGMLGNTIACRAPSEEVTIQVLAS